MKGYAEFLKAKAITAVPTGHDPGEVNPMLYDFQKDIVRWALRRGRAAIFADCGLGKTPIQLEWARHVHEHTGGNVLILAPLAVSKQTIREGQKFGVDVYGCRRQRDIVPGVNITNYEMLSHFDPSKFSGIVLDESSILKSYSGKIRNQIIESFHSTPYRLACTATPAPNDYMELGNHAEFLGVMTRTEMLAMFFIHDGSETQKWRLKGHGESEFWKWLCTWAVMIRKPSDLGYNDGDFILPPVKIKGRVVEADKPSEGFLFPVEAQTLMERRQARRASTSKRVAACADIINGSKKPWLIWCDLNYESAELTKAIDGAVEVKGADSMEHKENAMLGFSNGDVRILVTKPSIAGFGMNWQHCSDVAFVGLSDSYEQYYQAVRRCWRFGQKSPVNVHIITAETEGAVVQNIKRKEKDAERMAKNMVKHMADISSKEIRGTSQDVATYTESGTNGDGWRMILGDCVESMRDIDDDSIHYSIFSPPFSSLYTYSNSERDMGNSRTDEEFHAHFKFLIAELFRTIKPGRLVSFHCMNLTTSKERDGYIGIRDFRGDLIRAFVDAGFIFHSEVCIWKDPLIAAVRTKALGLMHKQLMKDSAMCRQGLPDYLITMRKPGENDEPVSHPDGFTEFVGEDEPTDGVYSHHVWRKYASPVWMDINQTRTLQFTTARDDKDERHICPLQLDVIARCLELWSNPGDTILSPFAGIGSEGYESIKRGRRFVGIELKESYYKQAIKNLRRAEKEKDRKELFDAEEVSA